MTLITLNDNAKLPGLEEAKKVKKRKSKKKKSQTAEEKAFAKNSNGAWN